MRETYENAQIEIHEFNVTDVIATSTETTMGEWVPRVNEGGASGDIWNNWNNWDDIYGIYA